MKHVTNSTAKRDVSREPSEHTVPLRTTHTWRAMTYRAGAASPPSQPSLRRPGGFCRSSLIFRRPPCLLRSPCIPWSNRARVNLQRITQIGSARSVPRKNCKLKRRRVDWQMCYKARSVTIWKLWLRKSLACDSPSIRRVLMCVDAIKKLLSFPPNQSIYLPSFLPLTPPFRSKSSRDVGAFIYRSQFLKSKSFACTQSDVCFCTRNCV